MSPATSFTTFRQRVPSQYLWPVLLLIGMCLGCLGVILVITTRAQDDLQLAREQQSIERAVQIAVEMAVHDLQDYAKWDDAVRHIAHDPDVEWISDNVVAYLSDTQGYSHVFVLNKKDDIAFSHSSSQATEAASLAFSSAFRRDIDNVRSIPITDKPILGGYVRVGSTVYIYSVAKIVPLTAKIKLTDEPTHLLAISRPVNSTFLRA